MNSPPAHGLLGVVTVPEFEPSRPLGGAEAVADQLVRRLSKWFEIAVLHGYDVHRLPRPGRRPLATATSAVDAFPLTDVVRHCGVIPGDLLSLTAREVLRDCVAVLAFERVLETPLQSPLYAVLGGTAYPHCQELAASRLWDKLIVPSEYVRETVLDSWLGESEEVRLILNGIDTNKFYLADPTSRSNDEPIRLLVPSRPDHGKGFRDALEFARACGTAGFAVVVHGFRRDSYLEDDLFYDEVLRAAERLKVELVFDPWVTHCEMPHAYRASALTLCLGELPEGFCLAAAESIACGTPVLARPVGFLRNLFPPEHGLTHIARHEDFEGIAARLPKQIEDGRQACFGRGASFVKKHYSEESMVAGYQELLGLEALNRESHA